MAITRADLVKVIDLPSSDDATFWIAVATSVAGEFVTGTLPAGRLDQITIFLAAHYAAIKYKGGQLTREKDGEAEQAYQVKHTDLQGLAETLYGRQAITLDTTGSLQALAVSPMTAQFRVV